MTVDMLKPATKLLHWYATHGRNLPWRRTRDPYKILVSEVILQQTQVERVKTYYREWLKVFPTWKRLANATNEQVVRQWAGLGYNRRGLALRDIAKQVNDQGVPQQEEEWKQLKGIGPYTAAALSAFAQKKRTMPIDTNIRRVLGRVLLGKTFPELEDDKAIQTHVDTFLPRRGNFYDVPQAIFDLATSICTKSPDCARCPLRRDCLAASLFLNGNVVVPKRSIKKAVERRHSDKSHPDRIYRGRILTVARTKPGTKFEDIGKIIDPSYDATKDQAWIEQLILRLEKDGLLKTHKRTILL